MKAFITSGTIDFLIKLQEKHSGFDVRLMSNNERAIAYYEHPNKEIFQSGRTYEILAKAGHVFETGYVAMNNIPVREESEPLFESIFTKRMGDIETVPGFQAVRLLKPKKGNVYIAFTQWNSKTDFENWKNSPEFAAVHGENTVKPLDYFEERPFLATYNMYVEEENKE
ncbi:antibiotic biosynthesis monooxygenase family protein [Oceanobacillus sp. CAU 1775]